MGAAGSSKSRPTAGRWRELFTDRFADAAKEARKPRAAAREPRPRARPVPELAGSQVLIVDDDIRNIYSLTSVLEATTSRCSTPSAAQEASSSSSRPPTSTSR